ncbi:MAG: PfkB family carbohydrate kinase [Candidatus Omnitrophota bacterium]|nr:PfkB family carbohydrate kinase [Candidatus Omnitrophota bacterium]MDD5654437.1 PfkB family carbohydrate kinase [Candidatus Omnitrophota bacterium]
MKNLKKIIGRFSKARVMVLGDLILDEYIWGDVERISPEAPVPVIWAKRRSYVPGGVANVAHNISSLDGSASISGVVGRRDDKNTQVLLNGLKKENIECGGVFFDERHTTVKTRIIAGHQQVIRVDWEDTHHLAGSLNKKIYNFISRNINKVDALIIEDYGKGVVNPKLTEMIIALARSKGKIITVDPKEENFRYYGGVTCITPNRREAENAVRNLKINDMTNSFKVNTDKLTCDEDLNRAGNELVKFLSLDSLLITLGENGMKLFDGGSITNIATQAQEVFDVSGAGDTVIAVFTLALACGASKIEAAGLANIAAGIVVGKVGTAVATRKELLSRIEEL